MSAVSVDYKNREVELVDEFCSECGTQLNETELEESETHLEGDVKMCTTHLHKTLGIPI